MFLLWMLLDIFEAVDMPDELEDDGPEVDFDFGRPDDFDFGTPVPDDLFLGIILDGVLDWGILDD